MRATGRLHRLWCNNVRMAREAAELTQKDVAEELGISQPRYAEIETGRHPPGLELMERLAPVLRVKPHRLLDPEFAREFAA